MAEEARKITPFPYPSEPVLKKIALLLRMDHEVSLGWRSPDRMARQSLLDDPAVAGWIDQMHNGGHIINDRYTRKL